MWRTIDIDFITLNSVIEYTGYSILSSNRRTIWIISWKRTDYQGSQKYLYNIFPEKHQMIGILHESKSMHRYTDMSL